MGKRHFKGGNNAQDKKRRREYAEQWKNAPRKDQSNVEGGEANENKETNNLNNNWNTEPIVYENARFEAFYRAQGFMRDEADWQAFMDHLRQPLPACFRIYPDYAFAEQLRAELMSFAGQTIELENGKEMKAVETLKWYPGGNGYRLGTDRRSIRKLEVLKTLHKWMIQHTDAGHITRQEAVSMVPPLALNVQPHHRCLDMCAAPGSKTSQLLEVVTRSFHVNNTSENAQTGLVVANDPDTDRAYMLVHQCKRLNSPLLVVTTHNGQSFPTILADSDLEKLSAPAAGNEYFDRVLCDVPCSGDGTMRKNPLIWNRWNTSMSANMHPLQLLIAKRAIRLLKDDGLIVYSTCSMSPYENEAVVAELLRQHKDTLELVDAREFLGEEFHCRPGLADWLVLDDYLAVKHEKAQRSKEKRLKKLEGKKESQEKPAEKSAEENAVAENVAEENAVENAVENQEEHAEEHNAVENNAEEENADDEEIDENEQVPAQTSTSAPTSSYIGENKDIQRCLEMKMSYFASYDQVPTNLQHKLKKSLFPPTAEEAAYMQLHKCLRCVPQDEDTGGFFVATLRKKQNPHKKTSQESAEATAEVPAVEKEEREEMQRAEEVQNARISGGETVKLGAGLVEFHQLDAATFEVLCDFYALDEQIVRRDDFYIRQDLKVPNQKGKRKRSAAESEEADGQPDMTAKTIFYFPAAVKELLFGDRSGQLKIVVAGCKAFEKKFVSAGAGSTEKKVEYRLLQDSMPFLAEHIHARKVKVTVQDMCNLLGGGLVSHSTLSKETLQQLSTISNNGSVICYYDYDPRDVLETESDENNNLSISHDQHRFYAVCWKGGSNTLNVMCSKVDNEVIKHQLESLRVYRPKILSQFAPSKAVAVEEPVQETTEMEISNA